MSESFKSTQITASKRDRVILTHYFPEYARDIADLFHSSIHAIDETIYTAEQKEAWAPTPPDYEFWCTRLSKTKPYLAVKNGEVVGFMELSDTGYIDCAYTLPEAQGSGVASALYAHIESVARHRKVSRLTLDASIIAKPFFEHRGFVLVGENSIARNGEILINYSMEKQLDAGDSQAGSV